MLIMEKSPSKKKYILFFANVPTKSDSEFLPWKKTGGKKFFGHLHQQQ